MQEVGARVVAKSGIPSDRFHLGKLVLQGLKDDPDFVLQVSQLNCQQRRNSFNDSILAMALNSPFYNAEP